MATTAHASFEIPELARILKGVDPKAYLAPARVLRRVIKRDRQLGGLGFVVPHRKTYVIDREPLLKIVDREELHIAATDEMPDTVILLVQPEADRLARMPIEEALLKYWRLLFHAQVDALMREKLATGALTAATVRQRIVRLGITEFNEAAHVMRQEDFLLPPQTAESIYCEFVAVFATLRRFANHLLPHYFPNLQDLAAVDGLIAQDLDADALFESTRLPGAPLPNLQTLSAGASDEESAPPASAESMDAAEMAGDNTQRRLKARADEMDAKGNNVRAAILRTRAADGDTALERARGELGKLSKRLQNALELTDADAEKWRLALLPLLQRAAHGFWSQEARFLYDLQRACVDSERGIYAVDVVEWCLSLGKLPIRRKLPGHQAVAIVRHLRLAQSRLRYIRLANGERQQLNGLLVQAVEYREHLLRERLRPVLAAALEFVELKPESVPERVGRGKLIEELLDRVVDYGHLNIGNLRDAISRNQLKLPDLKSPLELLSGDPLIRLNRKLAVDLDGVYRRGEIYMRWLHRLSSLAFGNVLGRLLVLYFILPFGLAFFVMITPPIAVEEGEKVAQWLGLMERPPPEHKGKKHTAAAAPDDATPDQAARPPSNRASRHAFPMPNVWGLAALGVFFLLLIHIGPFRASVYYGAGKVGRGLQTVFIHGPVWLMRMPALLALLRNPYLLWFRRMLFWPSAMAATMAWAAWMQGQPAATIVGIGVACYAVGVLLFNTRLGRDIEENTTDFVLGRWVWLTLDFVPGLLRFIMDVSRTCLEGVEQVLYTVNEWLHFRAGQSRIAIVVKGVLAFFWFWITYVIRFAINLLIEPQINPIKHFPVVTVSHKVCLPTIPLLRDILVQHFGMVRSRALGLATGIITGIPGIFGFAVWELKENWKLYRSNRARLLKPVRIGSHGETMLRLFKPGFHSGTVPKLFRKLRRAERRGTQRGVRKLLAELHHVEQCVAQFYERELLALLRQDGEWQDLGIALGHVRLSTNRVAVELDCPRLGPEPVVIGIEHQAGWLVAGVTRHGWLSTLDSRQRDALAAALAGVYKMAGVHITKEEVAQDLGRPLAAFDITPRGLVVWPGPDFAHEAVYDLTTGPMLEPRSTDGPLPSGFLPPLDTSRVLFASMQLSWQDWVQIWGSDKALVNGRRLKFAYAVLP